MEQSRPADGCPPPASATTRKALTVVLAAASSSRRPDHPAMVAAPPPQPPGLAPRRGRAPEADRCDRAPPPACAACRGRDPASGPCERQRSRPRPRCPAADQQGSSSRSHPRHRRREPRSRPDRAAARVKHGEHPRPMREGDVLDAHLETSRRERLGQHLGVPPVEVHGDIDVGSEPRRAVKQRGLRPEQVPAGAKPREDVGERPEKLNERRTHQPLVQADVSARCDAPDPRHAPVP